VHACRARVFVLGALLALIALLGMSTLSTWHGATIHSDDHSAAVSLPHAHGPAPGAEDAHGTADPDDLIHVVAHVVVHGLALPSIISAELRDASIESSWSRISDNVMAGLEPASLLRPPRA